MPLELPDPLVPETSAGVRTYSCECEQWSTTIIWPEEAEHLTVQLLEHLAHHHGLKIPTIVVFNH